MASAHNLIKEAVAAFGGAEAFAARFQVAGVLIAAWQQGQISAEDPIWERISDAAWEELGGANARVADSGEAPAGRGCDDVEAVRDSDRWNDLAQRVDTLIMEAQWA